MGQGKAARMVERQIAARGIRDGRVLAAMREVPREAFVADGLAEFAYDDAPLPIGEGQTISQPYIVALMAEAAEVGPGDRVLDVGTGSGYGAAVLSRLAGRVHSIERHAPLAEVARRRLAALGHDNVEVRVGDGSRGWPEAAPFDAIVVAAAAPEVPEALKEQLAAGGRLVIPVGSQGGHTQRLVRLRRTGPDRFEEDDLGDVAFVPLIGEQGWRGGDAPSRPAGRREETLPDLIARAAEPTPAIGDEAFARLADRVADARVVLIGEATHGTDEFYRARARLTQRLVEAHGFTIVAAEADWPDAARLDRYVRGRGEPPGAEQAFARFPTWMWRNTAVRDFVDWLRARNREVGDPGRAAGFYGLDLYSLHTSIRAVLDHLDREDPELARVARERYGCLTPWQRDPGAYGRAAARPGFRTCEAQVLATLRDLLRQRIDGLEGGDVLDTEMNARVVANAERYYRVMYHGAAESWNLRDTHMFETLDAVLRSRGPGAKAVVWAHNSHVGDAVATEMGVLRDELNIGQLCRERYGDAATALVGMGTDRGTVAAASDWDEPVELKAVRPSLPESYERLCRDSGVPAFLLELREGRADSALRPRLLRPRLERAIGVIYRPETERWSHYLEATLPRQFDLYLWFEVTGAVTPLEAAHLEGMPETYPFGV